MMRIPSTWCTTVLGPDWVDRGTNGPVRHHAPAERSAPTHAARHAGPRPLTAAERQLLAALDRARITNPTERAMFMAQMSHESAGFTHLRENLGAYTAARLLRVFPHKFDDLADAQSVVDEGADAVAERVYGDRANLGNTHDGDGTRYIGRGLTQLTGRANYAAAGHALHLDLINHPELAEDAGNSARIAIWYWQRRHIGPAARRGDMDAVTRIINGGLIGVADRRRRFHLYQGLLRSHDQPAAVHAPAAPVVQPAPAVQQNISVGPLG